MCQEAVTKEGNTLTTPRELGVYLSVDPSTFEGASDAEESVLEALAADPGHKFIDWRDCCLCGFDIEAIVKSTGRTGHWDDKDSSVFFIE